MTIQQAIAAGQKFSRPGRAGFLDPLNLPTTFLLADILATDWVGFDRAVVTKAELAAKWDSMQAKANDPNIKTSDKDTTFDKLTKELGL